MSSGSSGIRVAKPEPCFRSICDLRRRIVAGYGKVKVGVVCWSLYVSGHGGVRVAGRVLCPCLSA
jgi:hypothetical protein